MNTLGEGYEAQAVRWLRDRGQQILARNFCAKTGEIDIITLDQQCLVFVEVKARSNHHFGGAAVTVDWRKQQRIVRTAQFYLQSHPHYKNMPCRFDVIAFEPPQSPGELNVRWIRAAFNA